MKYRFNQSVKFQRCEIAFAFLSHFTTSLIATALLYALSALLSTRLAIDVLSIGYLLIFIVLFFVLFFALMVYYFKLDKGVEITESKLIYKIGYWSKFMPVKLFGFYDEIEIKDISDVEFLNCYDWKELKKDYRNRNYSWLYYGAYSKNIPVAKVTINNTIYLFPLEKSIEFTEKLKSTISD